MCECMYVCWMDDYHTCMCSMVQNLEKRAHGIELAGFLVMVNAQETTGEPRPSDHSDREDQQRFSCRGHKILGSALDLRIIKFSSRRVEQGCFFAENGLFSLP